MKNGCQDKPFVVSTELWLASLLLEPALLIAFTDGKFPALLGDISDSQ